MTSATRRSPRPRRPDPLDEEAVHRDAVGVVPFIGFGGVLRDKSECGKRPGERPRKVPQRSVEVLVVEATASDSFLGLLVVEVPDLLVDSDVG